MMRFKISMLYLIVLAGFFGSCDADPCKSSDNIILKIGFYTYKNGQRVDTLLDRLTIHGLDCLNDSSCWFHKNNSDINKAELFISALNDSTHFEMWIDTITAELIDTSEVVHIDSIQFYVTGTIRDTLVIITDSLVRVTWVDSTILGHDKDIFTILYDRIEKMESPDCGVYVNFKIEQVIYTRKNFDTIFIMQPIVDEKGFENIIIIF